METTEKHPMDVLVQREHDYILGFYDAMEIMLCYANQIEGSEKIPRDHRFSLLIASIESVYSAAADAHYDDIKETVMIFFDPEAHYTEYTKKTTESEVAQQEANS